MVLGLLCFLASLAHRSAASATSATLHLSGSRLGQRAPAALRFSVGSSAVDGSPVELWIQFGAQLLPAALIATEATDQGPCGHWFSELSSDHDGGFPFPSHCRWTSHGPSHGLGLSFSSNSWLSRSCGTGTACGYQLVLLLETLLDFEESDEVATISAGNIFGPVPVLAAHPTRAAFPSHLFLTLASTPAPAAWPVLLPQGGNATLRLELSDEALQLEDVFQNVSSLLLRLSLFPLAAWDLSSCDADAGLGSLPCWTGGMGLYQSALEIELNISNNLPTSLELTLTPAIRFGGFFPTRPVAELLIFGDVNDSYAEYAVPISCNQWWKLPDNVHFAILSSGRSGFGPSPFVQSRNQLLLRLRVPASLSNMEGLEDSGLRLLLPPGFECLEVTSENDASWAQLGVRPWECYWNLAQAESLYQDQVLLLNVTFRMPSEPSATGYAWQLQLRSRGAFADASEAFQMQVQTDAASMAGNQSWLSSVRALGLLQQVVLQPSSMVLGSLNWLSLTFMPRSAATRLVLDAPSGFDFGADFGCQVRKMSPDGRYERLQAPGDVTCVAEVWPCSQRAASEPCAVGVQNRARLERAGPWKQVLYGLEVSVINPATVEGTSFYIFTWDSEAALDGSHAIFNPDRSAGAERPWQLYREDLAVTIWLQDLRPYELHGVSLLSLSFVPTMSRDQVGLCITAPSGYVWGPPVSIALSRNCWAMASGPACRAVDNEIHWDFLGPLTAAEAFSLDLELQIPERLPLLGSNAFYVELDPLTNWAAAAVDVNSASGGPFLIQAISEASVTCSCTVLGYEANLLRFSARLPDMQQGWILNLAGDAGTVGFGFASDCALRAPVDLPDTVRPLLNVTCRAQRSEDARPALRLELLAQQPQGIYVLEVTARNPSETELGSWTFEILDSTGSPVVLPSSAAGCPLRRRLAVQLLQPESGAAAEMLGSTGRPGARNQILLQFMLSERPSLILQLQLRVVATRGFSFAGCVASALSAAEQSLVAPGSTPWPAPLGGCEESEESSHVARVELPEGLEAASYVLKLAVDNPNFTVAEALTEAKHMWSLELGDEASIPVPGPTFQLLRQLRLEPLSRAAQGTAAPLRMSFAPSSGPSWRLVVLAPSNVQFQGTCSLLEMGGPCEQCSLERGWCALTSQCGADGAEPCPEDYFSVAAARTGEPCRFEVRLEDLACHMEGPRLQLELQGMRLARGRRYLLQVSVAVSTSQVAENESWHVHSAVPGTWQPLDLAEAAAYPLLPALRWALQPAAALRLALRNGSSCGKALVSGAEERVEVQLQLPEDMNASDIFQIHLPEGLSFNGCAFDVVELVAPAPVDAAASCGDPGNLLLPWKEEELPEPGEVMNVTSTSQSSESSGVGETTMTTSAVNSSDPINATGESSTTTSTVTATNESEVADATNDSGQNMTNVTTSTAPSRRLALSCHGDTTDLSDCFQCDCGSGCVLRFSSLSGAGAWLSFQLRVRYATATAADFWRITQRRADRVVAMEVAPAVPVRPRLSVTLGFLPSTVPFQTPAPWWQQRAAGSEAALRLQLMPVRAARHLRIVAVWPPNFSFTYVQLWGPAMAAVEEARGPRLLLSILLEPLRRSEVHLGPVRLGEDGGESIFHAATLDGVEVVEEVLNLTTFQIPGAVFPGAALLRRLGPLRLGLPQLPARLAEAAWMSLTFRLGQGFSGEVVFDAGALVLTAADTWELRAGEGYPVALYQLDPQGQVAAILRSNSTAVGTRRVQTAILDLMDPTPTAYVITVWAMPLIFEDPPGALWTLELWQGETLVSTSDQGFHLPLDSWPLPSLSLQLEMASPPPGGRTYLQLRIQPWSGSGWVLLQPPPGWRVGTSTSLVSLGYRELSKGAEVQLEAAASLETTSDTVWYVLAAASEPTFDEQGVLNATLLIQSWGQVDGANVAPMQTSLSHANLANLRSCPLILTLRLDQDSPVSVVRITAPGAYGNLSCSDPLDSQILGAERWPMSLRRFGPSCAVPLPGVNRTEVLLAQPLPVGFWTLALSVALPETAPLDVFRVEVFDLQGNLVDAATSITAPELLSNARWPVTAPQMILRSLVQRVSARAEMEITFQVEGDMKVESGSIKAMLISLPSGVLFDESSSMQITGVPLERGTPTVSPTQAMVRFETMATLRRGTVRLRFGALLPNSEPVENVWSLELCSQSSCGGDLLRFPLPGPSLLEEPILEEEVGHARRAALVSMSGLWILGILRPR